MTLLNVKQAKNTGNIFSLLLKTRLYLLKLASDKQMLTKANSLIKTNL